MKTIYGKCESSKEISLSKAAKILFKFVSAENGASQVINAYLRRTSAGFDELNQIHKELKTSHSHKKKKNHKRDTTTDDDGVRVVKKTNQEELSNGRVKSESVVDDDDDDDGEKSTLTAVKLSQELNGSVNENGSEKHKKKNKNKKREVDGEGRLDFGERDQNGIQAEHNSSGMEEGKKHKKEKNKNKHKNTEGGENAKVHEQEKETENNLSNTVKGENGGIVGSQDIKMEQKKKRKFEDVEDKPGDSTEKRIKRKH